MINGDRKWSPLFILFQEYYIFVSDRYCLTSLYPIYMVYPPISIVNAVVTTNSHNKIVLSKMNDSRIPTQHNISIKIEMCSNTKHFLLMFAKRLIYDIAKFFLWLINGVAPPNFICSAISFNSSFLLIMNEYSNVRIDSKIPMSVKYNVHKSEKQSCINSTQIVYSFIT